ncbi:transposase family protein [Streptomyces nojiriensis]|uniref:transposase family protein n=1 Tax=Streptomyces nojiriensis TaxID=66374 RepID=UPI0036505421
MVARGRAAGSACPGCGRFPDRVHDLCQRRLKDLPLAEQGCVIRLTVRRFICGAAGCPSPDVRRAVLPAGRPARTVHDAAQPRPGRAGRRSAGCPAGLRRGTDDLVTQGPGPA